MAPAMAPAMAVGRLVAMASGRAIRGAGSGIERVVPPVTLQQDHGTNCWSPVKRRTIAPCIFDVARLANARVIRCGATSTSTISRRDGILEREEESLRPAGGNSQPSVARSFEAEADVGRVECSGKGCRPVYEDKTSTSSSFLSMACPVDSCWHGGFPSHAELQIKIQPQIKRRISGGGMFLSQSAATTLSFEVAVQDVSHDSQHLSDFAVFSWKSLGDVDKAEELYQEALDHASPDDTDVLASYANFLWQCDQ